MHVYVNVLGTMAPKGKYVKIKALRRKHKDEPSNTEQTPQLSKSLEILDAQPDAKASRPQTRAPASARQPQALVANPSQSKVGYSD